LRSPVFAVAGQVNGQHCEPATQQRADQPPLEGSLVVSRPVDQTNGAAGRGRRCDKQARDEAFPVGDADCQAMSL
jgi:hypothetical protein